MALCRRHKQTFILVPQYGNGPHAPRAKIIWCKVCGSLYDGDLTKSWTNPEGKPSSVNDKLKRIRKILDEPKLEVK